MNRTDTPMLMVLTTPVYDHLGKPVRSFKSASAAWKQEGLVYVVLVDRNTAEGKRRDAYTIPITNACICVYNIDVEAMMAEQERRQKLAAGILETPEGEGQLQ